MTDSPLLAALGVISLAGLTCGVLDITCTLTLSKLNGIAPMRLPQAVASGLLGQKSFAGGGILNCITAERDCRDVEAISIFAFGAPSETVRRALKAGLIRGFYRCVSIHEIAFWQIEYQ